MRTPSLTATALPAVTSSAVAQETTDPFPEPIEAEAGVIAVDVVEFAGIPDVDGEPARMMTLVHVPGIDRIFVSDQRGPLYIVGEDGEVTEYLDVDDATGELFVADIGQNTVEEVTRDAAGDDLGWNEWEGSFRFVGRSGVSTEDPRAASGVTYPVAEYDHRDPLWSGNDVAVTGLHVVRDTAVPALQDRLLFGDLPSGELFHLDADDLPSGGREALRRVLFRHDGSEPRTLLELVREKNREQGRSPASRVDLRLGTAPGGRIFLLNKHDGTLRLIVP